MGKRDSDKRIKQILQKDIKVPDQIQEAVEVSYARIGGQRKVTMRYTRRHKHLVVLAATLVLVMGTSAVVFAAGKWLSVNLDKGAEKVTYDFQVNKEKDAHEIEVIPAYLPEGFKAADENSPYRGKWVGEDGKGGLSIIPMNAAELDEISRIKGIQLEFNKEDLIKELDINGTKAALFSSGKFVEDSVNNYVNLFLFNEEEGYGVQIFSDQNLPEEELVKVAENLKITVLDTVVPYKTEVEIQNEKETQEEWAVSEAKKMETGVSGNVVKQIGEEVAAPQGYPTDIRFTVEDVKVADSLPAGQYPITGYSDFEGEIAPWLKEDGSLKPYDRYRYSRNEGENVQSMEGDTAETVNSKFVVVKMKMKNYSDVKSNAMTWMAPELTTLVRGDGGNYDYPEEYFRTAQKEYTLQYMGGNHSNLAVYYDDPYYVEGEDRERNFLFRPVEPGEEREYTVVYVVDEDRLGQMCLWFYSALSMQEEDGSVYVDIAQ